MNEEHFILLLYKDIKIIFILNYYLIYIIIMIITIIN
jgi:hypothetical protein